MSRIQAFDREIELLLNELSSPEAQSARLAEFAAEQIAEAKAINREATGTNAPHREIVDGRLGAPLSSVRPNGVIIADFDVLTEVLGWIGDELIRTSPVLTGRFRQSHVLYVDGEPHEPGTPIPSAELYTFVNSQPYARKIEKGFGDAVTDGLYEGISAVAHKRFGNIARITFGWQALHGAAALDRWVDNASQKKADRTLTGAKLDEWRRRQPTIFVRPF